MAVPTPQNCTQSRSEFIQVKYLAQGSVMQLISPQARIPPRLERGIFARQKQRKTEQVLFEQNGFVCGLHFL